MRLMRVPMLPRVAALIALLASLALPGDAARAAPDSGLPSLVMLVRHAEENSGEGDDPSLTPEGEERARALAAALRDAHVGAILVTPFRRTQDTARPLAQALGIVPEVIPLQADWSDTTAYVDAVIEALQRHPGRVVLVVSHQNTVPQLIAALGGPRLPRICDEVYGNLYALVPGAPMPDLVVGHYGRPDSGEECDE